MFLKEYEGRELFKKYGIRIPEGQLIEKKSAQEPQLSAQCRKAAESLSAFNEYVLKAQLLTGHRGQRGGVRFTDGKKMAKEIANMFQMTFGDEKVDEILVEGKLSIEREFFVSLAVDRFRGLPVFLISAEGGIDIEELALQKPSKIEKVFFDDLLTFPDQKINKALQRIDVISDTGRHDILEICRRLFTLFSAEDAILAEINPLVLTKQGEFFAADSKIAIDDNALKRRPAYLKRFLSHLTPLEQQARMNDLSYVELDGNIAIVGNGAGLVMATLDTISFYGGHPANFCDIGGGASGKMMEKALDIVLKKEPLSCILINVFGGITHCDEVAQGIVKFIGSHPVKLPIVVRMVGTNSDIAQTILTEAGIHVHLVFDDACRKAAQLSKQ